MRFSAISAFSHVPFPIGTEYGGVCQDDWVLASRKGERLSEEIMMILLLHTVIHDAMRSLESPQEENSTSREYRDGEPPG